MRSLASSRTRAVMCAAFSALVLLVPLSRTYAVPSSPEIEAKRSELQQAAAALDTMHDEAEVLVEEYNAITEALEATRRAIAAMREELAQAERDFHDAQALLSRRAAQIYKNGHTGVLDVLLGTRTFEELLGRVELAVRINRADADAVERVREARARVEASQRTLEQREAEQIALRAEAEVRTRAIEAQIARRETFKAGLDADLKRLIAEEEERQRKLAEERARQAQLAAARAAAGRIATDRGSLGAGRPEVVAIALRYLGVPYQWGGASPTAGFDCSGLCWYVYRQIGIELPRTSRSQFRVGQHIAPDRLDALVPGDLVFFGTDGDPNYVHHVGIYVGSGNYVHAPRTGDVVRVESLLERAASRGDYVGASRL